jgi:hypothetical protein
MEKSKAKRRRHGRYIKRQTIFYNYRHYMAQRVTVATDRQTHALVATYARQEDLNMQDAVTRLLGYGLSMALAKQEEAEKERRVLEILEPVGNR